MPVDADAETVDLSERVAVRRGEGLVGSGRDFGGAVAAVEAVVEEEAYFGDGEGSCDDERAEEVVDGIGLEGKDGRLGASEDDGLAEIGHHEG